MFEDKWLKLIILKWSFRKPKLHFYPITMLKIGFSDPYVEITIKNRARWCQDYVTTSRSKFPWVQTRQMAMDFSGIKNFEHKFSERYFKLLVPSLKIFRRVRKSQAWSNGRCEYLCSCLDGLEAMGLSPITPVLCN